MKRVAAITASLAMLTLAPSPGVAQPADMCALYANDICQNGNGGFDTYDQCYNHHYQWACGYPPGGSGYALMLAPKASTLVARVSDTIMMPV